MACIALDDKGSALCSPTTIYVRTVRRCPVCGKRRRLVGFDQLWYGITWTCLGCGDQWCGVELLPRPFRPRWRRDNIARAASYWSDAVRLFGPEHQRWTDEQMAGRGAVA